MNTEPIQIGGVTPFTTVDFPGQLAAVVFCQGCPWRCRYCHNPHLRPFNVSVACRVERYGEAGWAWSKFLRFLEVRQGFLDGVVFSGGEPTFQEDLPGAMKQVRDLGFKVGLHTAGPDPDLLKPALAWTDWVGLDIKAPFDERYDELVGRSNTAEMVRKSLRHLIDSGVPFQLRTTVHPDLLSPGEFLEIQASLRTMGAPYSIVQPFRSEGCEDQALAEPASR